MKPPFPHPPPTSKRFTKVKFSSVSRTERWLVLASGWWEAQATVQERMRSLEGPMDSRALPLWVLKTSPSGARTALVLWINMMSFKAEAEGTRIHRLHSSLWEFFSAALNIRIELKILRAGPSLMLIILTMSVWVMSKNASPSICWNKGRKKQTKEYGLTRCIVAGHTQLYYIQVAAQQYSDGIH